MTVFRKAREPEQTQYSSMIMLDFDLNTELNKQNIDVGRHLCRRDFQEFGPGFDRPPARVSIEQNPP